MPSDVAQAAELPPLLQRLARVAPGLPALVRYDRRDFPADLRAGLAVAAVALPVGVAYAELTGFSPVVGLYSTILPMLAYAVFGTSRQLIVGPDAATCAVVAAAIAPLAAGDAETYQSLSVALAAIAGLFCIAAGLLRLGALADFLSKPILVGFMNGIALSITLGQIGKILGFGVKAGGIVPRLVEVAGRLGETHLPTLAVGLGAFAVMVISRRRLPRVPAALVAMVAAGLAVRIFGLDLQGVAVVGSVPAGLPHLRLPVFPPEDLPQLVGAAAGLALISFSSAMVTGRSFAAKNRYEIDADRELAALGAANIAAALSQGFAISGGDSRTAVSDSSGGRTQVTGLVAAGVIGLVLLFFTGALRYVPIPALGAVLVMAALSLVDTQTLGMLWKLARWEFGVSLLATLGVVATGVVDAMLVVVGLSLVLFIRAISRPAVEILGRVPGRPGFHGIQRYADATTTPGLLLLRFNGPLVFFNAGYFKQSVLRVVAGQSGLRWVILDLIPIGHFDVTGAMVFREVADTLAAAGIRVGVAGRQTELREWGRLRGLKEIRVPTFPSVGEAARAFAAGRLDTTPNEGELP